MLERGCVTVSGLVCKLEFEEGGTTSKPNDVIDGKVSTIATM